MGQLPQCATPVPNLMRISRGPFSAIPVVSIPQLAKADTRILVHCKEMASWRFTRETVARMCSVQRVGSPTNARAGGRPVGCAGVALVETGDWSVVELVPAIFVRERRVDGGWVVVGKRGSEEKESRGKDAEGAHVYGAFYWDVW